MAKSITYVLPPRHGGYRPAASDAKYRDPEARKSVPRPPAGPGGGSKAVPSNAKAS